MRRLTCRWPRNGAMLYSTTQWRTLRQANLEADPWCEPCKRRDKPVQANTVDHCVPISQGGEPFPPLAGLMSMCASCHGYKTRAVDRPGGSGKRSRAAAWMVGRLMQADPWFGAQAQS